MTNTRAVFYGSILLVWIFGLTSCAPTNRLEITKAASEIQQIANQTYSLKSTSARKIVFECTSDVFKYAVSKIKNDTLRSQLSNIKFHVTWAGDSNYLIEIKDVPTISDNESRKNVLAVLDRAKDRMLGAFLLSNIVFNGLGITSGDIKIYKASDGLVMTRIIDDFSEELRFDDRNQLRESAIIKKGKVINKTKYKFEERGRIYFLKSIKNRDEESGISTEIRVEYVNYKGIIIPKSFSGGSQIEAKDYSDVVRVTRAHILS